MNPGTDVHPDGPVLGPRIIIQRSILWLGLERFFIISEEYKANCLGCQPGREENDRARLPFCE